MSPDTMAKMKEAEAVTKSTSLLTKSVPFFITGLLFLLLWAPQFCGAQPFFASPETGNSGGNTSSENSSINSISYLPDSLNGKSYNSSRSTSRASINSETWPGWFSSDPEELIGVGIAPYSQYNPQKGIDSAFKKATQDLNANKMTSVYLESFSFSGYDTHYHEEYAIPAKFDSSSVAYVDSSIVGNWAFAMVKPTSDTGKNSFRPIPDIEIPNWASDQFNPVHKSGFWLSSGSHEKSEYNPYQSWSRAKLDALSKLSHYIQTGVQNTTRSYNSRSRETRYTYSKCLIRNIRVVQRKSGSDSLYVLIAVHQDDIETIN